MRVARTSRAPRKIPGNPRELFTWFGKSPRPVATIRAPASVASQGQISGTGFAQAKTTGSRSMDWTHAGSIVPGPGRENARQTSAPRIASAIPPRTPSALVSVHTRHLSANRSCTASISVRPGCNTPRESQATIAPGSTPAARSKRKVATLAAPIPTIAMRTRGRSRPSSCNALRRPAKTTVAVPC